jgi:hypothetical protein
MTKPPADFDENRTIDYAAWTAMKASLRRRAGEIDEDRAIDWAALVVPRFIHKMNGEYGRGWLRTELRKALEEGQQPITDFAIHAAEQGRNAICDAELRATFRKMVAGTLPRRGDGHLQIWAYGERAIERAPLKLSEGHIWEDNFMRDIQACNFFFLLWRELSEFGVKQQRDQKGLTQDAGSPDRSRPLSAIAIGVAVLGRRFTEANAQNNLWGKLPGEMVRCHAPALYLEKRGAALLPPNHQSNHTRRALLNGTSRASLASPRSQTSRIVPDKKS